MWMNEEVNQNDENLGNMDEELQKLLEKIALFQNTKKAGAFVISPALPRIMIQFLLIF